MRKSPALICGLFLICTLFALSGCLLEAGIGEAIIFEEGAPLSVGTEPMSVLVEENGWLSSTDRRLITAEERPIFGGYITGETPLLELENVRLVERGGGLPPELRLIDQNSKPIAEVINQRTLRFLDSQREVTLHHDVYAIHGDNVAVRTTLQPNTFNSEKILTHQNMRIVISLEQDESGFYKVLMGRNAIYWIPYEALIPVILSRPVDKNDTLLKIKYPSGKVREKYESDGENINGEYVYYHYNGMLWTQRLYAHGKLKEVLSCYSISGAPLDKGNLRNGNGQVNIYDTQGTLKYIQTYESGLLISSKFVGTDVVSEQWWIFKTNPTPTYTPSSNPAFR